VRTAIDWNNLEDNIVQSKTTEDFKTAILAVSETKSALFSTHCIKAQQGFYNVLIQIQTNIRELQ
jgi:hypothetical protein